MRQEQTKQPGQKWLHLELNVIPVSRDISNVFITSRQVEWSASTLYNSWWARHSITYLNLVLKDNFGEHHEVGPRRPFKPKVNTRHPSKPRTWHQASIQNQWVDTRHPFKTKEFTPGINPNQRVDTRHQSKPNSWHQASIQTKELTPGIQPN